MKLASGNLPPPVSTSNYIYLMFAKTTKVHESPPSYYKIKEPLYQQNMEENISITKEIINYYDYANISMETQFILLAMSHIEYKIGKVLSNHNQDKSYSSDEGNGTKVWEIKFAGDNELYLN